MGFFQSRPLIQDLIARARLPPPARLDHNKGSWGAWPTTGRAPSSAYGALNLKVTTPTWSRWPGHSVWLTFGRGNDPRDASSGGAVWPGFDDGDSGSWWRSDSKKQSYGFLMTSSSSLIASFAFGRRWIKLTRRLTSCAMVWCCRQKFDELGPLYIGVLVPTHRGFGILTNLSPTRFWIIADKEKLRRG
jgi:hypothetical protein